MKYQHLLPLALFLTVSHRSSAAGYQLFERSAAGLGRAFSGEAAMGDDATVIASNPAGMTLLEDEWSFAIGASGIFPEVEVSGVYAPPGAPAGFTVPALGGNVADDAYLPYAYVAKRLNEQFSVGFGAFSTFGLKTNYPVGFTGRAIADFSELLTLNLNPSVAWKINEQWSLGAGFNALYADGTLTSSNAATLPVLDLAGDDWGYGFNVGVLFAPADHTRFGLHYRSSVDLDLEGRTISVIPAFNGPTTLAVELPDSVEFSAVHDLNESWSLHGDVMWTNWSKFQELAPFIAGAPAQPPVQPENWKDSWRFALGTTWQATESWTFRAGVAYDRTPVSEADLTLRIPDADRLWVTLGFTWEFSPCWNLDVGYAHIFADDVYISEGSAATGFFRGQATGSADVVSVGLSTEF